MASTWYKIGENAWINDGGGSYLTYLPAEDTPEYTVTVNIDPEGAGTVTGSGTYTQGTTVILTATPNENYVFSSWSDGTTGNPYTFELTEDKTLTARFSETAVITTVASPSSYGSVTGGGTYAVGQEIQLVATPNLGYKFVKWEDDSTNSYRTIIVPGGGGTYTASFQELSRYTVTAYANPDGSGTIDGTGTYTEGSSVTLTARAAKGYKFKKWSNGVTNRVWTFDISGDVNVEAIFEVDTSEYILTLNVNPENSGTVTGAGTYVAGKTVTLKATPAENYEFVKWSDGTTTAEYEYTIYEDTTLTANFNYIEPTVYYTITTVSDPEAGGSIDGGGTYAEGSVVTLTATANTGYEFSSWSTGATTSSISVVADSNKTITANFNVVVIKYNVILESKPNEAGILSGDGLYEEGSSVTISETHDSNKYRFTGWYKESGTAMEIVSSDSTYTFTIDSNKHFYAYYDDLSIIKTVTISSSDTSRGTVSGGGVYGVGTQVTALAKPNNGYEFTKWSNNITDNPYYFNVTDNVNLIGYFKIKSEEKNLVTFNSSSVSVADKLTGTILNYNNQHTYRFYWTSGIDTIERELSNVGTGSDVQIIIDNIFESLYTTGSSYEISISCKEFNGEDLVAYQNNIKMNIVIGDNFSPTISFGEITWSGLFDNTKIIAGYSTYSLPVQVLESAPEGYQNHASLSAIKASVNAGNCTVIPGNETNSYLITGTAQSSTETYNLIWTVSVSDSRQKSAEKTYTYENINGYAYPRLKLDALYLCDEMGAESKTGKNIFIAFEPEISEIEGNFVDPSYCYITINNGETKYDVSANENIFYAVVGDEEISSTVNYIISVFYYDEVMKTLSGSYLTPIQTTYSMNSKLPLSLLDDLSGNVGLAIGVEASQKNKVEIALDTTFAAGININASKYDGATKDTVSRTSYDLLNDGGINSIIKKDNIKEGVNYFANSIQCMSGEDYENLTDIDEHTLFFLTSVPSKESK